MPLLALSLIALFLLWLPASLRRRRRPGRTLILTPERSTVETGGGSVRSVQSALVTLPQSVFKEIWNEARLEDLGRTYWLFLSRATLGLVRVRYTDTDRSAVLLFPWLPLLRFGAPEYEFGHGRGKMTWAIKDGLLVSRRGRGFGHLSLEVQCEDPQADPATLLVEVEVTNFYPAIASRGGFACYRWTQAFIHVRVTHGFLRRLAKLDLSPSQVRRFPDQPN